MGIVASYVAEGQGKVVLKMTLGKLLALNNMLYVSKIQKNLVSNSLLNKHVFKMVSGSLPNKYEFKKVFKLDKVILSKSRMYVGKGYISDGLFKLNIITIINKVSNTYAS